jgi:hypothetical protein
VVHHEVEVVLRVRERLSSSPSTSSFWSNRCVVSQLDVLVPQVPQFVVVLDVLDALLLQFLDADLVVLVGRGDGLLESVPYSGARLL